jgi:hypothetical protein
METKKKKIFIAQNIAEPMWSGYIAEKKKVVTITTYLENPEELITEAQAEDTTVVNVIDHKALTNEINKRFGLGLNLNTNGLKAEIKETEEESCHVIYVISVTNLKDFYKFADKEELPEGVNLRIIRYEIQ